MDSKENGKKNLNLIILRILFENTDSEHALLQKDIVEKVYDDYGMKVDRRTVSNNINALNVFFGAPEMVVYEDDGYRLTGNPFSKFRRKADAN